MRPKPAAVPAREPVKQVKEAIEYEFRVYETGPGSDIAYVEAPGLKELKKVLVGGTEIPISIVEQYPTNTDATAHEFVELPLVILDDLEDVGTIIRRSPKSNDGVWQPNTKITVFGIWE